MKTYIKAIFLILLFPFICMAEDSTPKISVTGFAKEKVTPDEINWSLTITSKDKNLETLANAHTDIASKVLKALKSLGVKKENLKTSQMRFNEEWNYSGRKRFKDGYVASTNVNFKFNDFSKYLPVWKKLSEYEQVAVNSANFSFSKVKEIREKLKNKALLNAKEKAQDMVKTLGLSLGEVLYISESSSPVVRPRYQKEVSLASARAEAPIEPGSTDITSSVFVDFRIIN